MREVLTSRGLRLTRWTCLAAIFTITASLPGLESGGSAILPRVGAGTPSQARSEASSQARSGASSQARSGASSQGGSGEPDFDPPTYVVYRASGPVRVDGQLDEPAWEGAPWTGNFVDIEGGPAPHLRTRAKMVWDDEALYVAAELEEPHVWASITERDAAVFRDNAFEVFIDPDGDSHNYYEIEINALETIWDLLLVRPYRDGGPSLSAWDVAGLDAVVHVDGTLNEPSDTDDGWTVEMALPWSVLREAAPERRRPRAGEQWRVNFARPHWPTRVVDGAYEKIRDDDTGRFEASWWVWAPQGAVDMHRPEWWGYVQFEDTAGEPFVEDANERVKWALRRLYHRQRAFHEAHGRYARAIEELDAEDIGVEGIDFEPELRSTQSLYEITAEGVDGTVVHIREDGRVWTTTE